MKNFIKVITIFEVIIFFSPIRPMESEQTSCYSFKVHRLKELDPLSRMDRIPILLNNKFFISGKHPLRTSKGVALHLTTIKALKESNSIKNEKILKKISDAVSKGTSVISMHNIKLHNRKLIKITPSRTPISALELIKSWPEQEPLVGESKKNNLVNAILKGKLNRKKRLSCILTVCTHDELEIKVPQDIIDLILSLNPECNIDEEKQYLSKLIIKQAKQKFNDEDKKTNTNGPH